MHWHKIDNEQALDKVIESSYQAPVLVFKHSFRCSISTTALSRLERSWDQKASGIQTYFIDVIGERPLSQLVAHKTGVHHESPQAILLKDGKVAYHDSHLGISYTDIISLVTTGF